MRKGTAIKEGEDVFGHLVRVRVVKNKVAPPFRRASFNMMFGQGISRVGEVVDLAVEHDIIKKSGSWFSYGEVRLGQGQEKALQFLLDNPELMAEVEAKVMDLLKAAQ